MTTTISIKANGHLVLPKELLDRKRLRPGSALRVTERGEGFYLTPISEPTLEEFEDVVRRAGSVSRPQTARDRRMIDEAIREYRAKKRRQGV